MARDAEGKTWRGDAGRDFRIRLSPDRRRRDLGLGYRRPLRLPLNSIGAATPRIIIGVAGSGAARYTATPDR